MLDDCFPNNYNKVWNIISILHVQKHSNYQYCQK